MLNIAGRESFPVQAALRLRDRLAVLGPILLGFLAGTIAGAVAYVGLDLWCMLFAVVATAGLAAWASLRED